MMRIEHEYVRWFNRRRRRDGSLFRGRFLSRRVTTERYWRALLRYVDDNPVTARIVDRAVDYPWCSAWHYARSRGPPWLERTEVEASVVSGLALSSFRPSSYAAFVALANGEESRWLVERSLRSARDPDVDLLDHLVRASPRAVVDWMRRKAQLADGTRPNEVLATPEHVGTALERCASADGVETPTFEICRAGLFRDLAGLRIREIEVRVGRPRTTVARWLDEHRRRICFDAGYAELAGAAAQAAIQRTASTRK
jgi:hypothetical protein